MRARLALAAAAVLVAAGCTADDTPAAPAATAPPPATTTAAPPTPTASRPPLPTSMGALGDSMTRAFFACDGLGDCPVASWATGSLGDLGSHAMRLEALGGDVDARNLARSGARVSDLPGQVDAAVAARVRYVTVLIGANDACASSEEAMTPVAEFARTFDAALSRLTRADVLVVSVPDLLRLWEIGHRDPHVVETWQRTGVCGSMLGDPTDTSAAATARRQRVRQRVAGYNAAMARSCAKLPRCRWDGNAVFDYDFTLAELSDRDYWHPSLAGQRSLARVSWEAGFWA